MKRTTLRLAATLGSAALAGSVSVLPAQAAAPASERPGCESPADAHAGEASAGARGGFGDTDHRDVSAEEQRTIGDRVDRILARQEGRPGAAAATIPTYVHVMRDEDGNGNVTDAQIEQQMEVLNETFAGSESPDAAGTGFTFTLADTIRYDNKTWHRDKASKRYRRLTRQGDAGTLNMWLVDFKLLGVATFPWDYAKNGDVDGVRVNYDSLPGGSIENYNLGKTATHEVGHWLGLFHTFQGGCTVLNDEVADTPAQSSPTTGCPEGRDSCELPGLDPIHNYMDYSYDSCYDQFTPDQSTRMNEMFAAFRA